MGNAVTVELSADEAPSFCSSGSLAGRYEIGVDEVKKRVLWPIEAVLEKSL